MSNFTIRGYGSLPHFKPGDVLCRDGRSYLCRATSVDTPLNAVATFECEFEDFDEGLDPFGQLEDANVKIAALYKELREAEDTIRMLRCTMDDALDHLACDHPWHAKRNIVEALAASEQYA